MSTAEIEAALIGHPGVAETAVVGVNDEMSKELCTPSDLTDPGIFLTGASL